MEINPIDNNKRIWIKNVFDPMDTVLDLLNRVQEDLQKSDESAARANTMMTVYMESHLQHLTQLLSYCLGGDPQFLKADVDLWREDIALVARILIDDDNNDKREDA